MKKNLAFIFIAGLLVYCSSGGKAESSNESASQLTRDDIRLKQYKVEGEKLYTAYCANCHQRDGKGLASLYPPLAGSDYLLADLPRAACIIKNGLMGEIIVNGDTYNQMMPGNPITNLEIAEILSYVTNSWGNEAGLTSVKDVEKWLKECEE